MLMFASFFEAFAGWKNTIIFYFCCGIGGNLFAILCSDMKTVGGLPSIYG